MNLENLYKNLTFWLFVIGLTGDVVVAIAAVIIVHKKSLPKSKRSKLEKFLEWSAATSALLVLLAILSEHKLDDYREAARQKSEETIRTITNDLQNANIELRKLRPKPLKERLIAWIINLGPEVPELLRKAKEGNSLDLNVHLNAVRYAQLKDFEKETNATEYIGPIRYFSSMQVDDEYVANVNFLVYPALAK